MVMLKSNEEDNMVTSTSALSPFFELSDEDYNANLRPHISALHKYCTENRIPLCAFVQRTNTETELEIGGAAVAPGSRACRRIHLIGRIEGQDVPPPLIMTLILSCFTEEETTGANSTITDPTTGESFPRDFEVSEEDYEAHIAPHVKALSEYCNANSLPLVCMVQRSRSGKECNAGGAIVVPRGRTDDMVELMAVIADPEKGPSEAILTLLESRMN